MTDEPRQTLAEVLGIVVSEDDDAAFKAAMKRVDELEREADRIWNRVFVPVEQEDK